MDFTLSKELQMLQKAVREFAKKKIAPNVDEWDAEHHLPYKEVMRPMGDLGFFGTVIPEEYGGEEMGWMAAMIVTEPLSMLPWHQIDYKVSVTREECFHSLC